MPVQDVDLCASRFSMGLDYKHFMRQRTEVTPRSSKLCLTDLKMASLVKVPGSKPTIFVSMVN